MKIVFMGTPEFAVPSLDALVRNGYDVVLVVTQKDKPRDRGKETKAPAVKTYAVSAGIPVLQPERLRREPEMVEAIHQTHPDVLVTCAFGQLLPQSVLDIPALGTINVHGSLLPALRGAAPIQWAILNGYQQTGITTMFTDIGLDTGDMLLKEIVEIPEDMTAGELHDMMSVVGAATLIKTLRELEAGNLRRHQQEETGVSHAPRITKAMGEIDWSRTAWEIHNQVRGLEPWPGAYTYLDGKQMRIINTKSPGRLGTEPTPLGDADASNDIASNGVSSNDTASNGVAKDAAASDAAITEAAIMAERFMQAADEIRPLPGTILSATTEGLLVQAGDKPLLVREIQMPSSRRMRVGEWLNGHSVHPGTVLGKN